MNLLSGLLDAGCQSNPDKSSVIAANQDGHRVTTQQSCFLTNNSENSVFAKLRRDLNRVDGASYTAFSRTEPCSNPSVSENHHPLFGSPSNSPKARSFFEEPENNPSAMSNIFGGIESFKPSYNNNSTSSVKLFENIQTTSINQSKTNESSRLASKQEDFSEYGQDDSYTSPVRKQSKPACDPRELFNSFSSIPSFSILPSLSGTFHPINDLIQNAGSSKTVIGGINELSSFQPGFNQQSSYELNSAKRQSSLPPLNNNINKLLASNPNNYSKKNQLNQNQRGKKAISNNNSAASSSRIMESDLRKLRVPKNDPELVKNIKSYCIDVDSKIAVFGLEPLTYSATKVTGSESSSSQDHIAQHAISINQLPLNHYDFFDPRQVCAFNVPTNIGKISKKHGFGFFNTCSSPGGAKSIRCLNLAPSFEKYTHYSTNLTSIPEKLVVSSCFLVAYVENMFHIYDTSSLHADRQDSDSMQPVATFMLLGSAEAQDLLDIDTSIGVKVTAICKVGEDNIAIATSIEGSLEVFYVTSLSLKKLISNNSSPHEVQKLYLFNSQHSVKAPGLISILVEASKPMFFYSVSGDEIHLWSSGDLRVHRGLALACPISSLTPVPTINNNWRFVAGVDGNKEFWLCSFGKHTGEISEVIFKLTFSGFPGPMKNFKAGFCQELSAFFVFMEISNNNNMNSQKSARVRKNSHVSQPDDEVNSMEFNCQGYFVLLNGNEPETVFSLAIPGKSIQDFSFIGNSVLRILTKNGVMDYCIPDSSCMSFDRRLCAMRVQRINIIPNRKNREESTPRSRSRPRQSLEQNINLTINKKENIKLVQQKEELKPNFELDDKMNKSHHQFMGKSNKMGFPLAFLDEGNLEELKNQNEINHNFLTSSTPIDFKNPFLRKESPTSINDDMRCPKSQLDKDKSNQLIIMQKIDEAFEKLNFRMDRIESLQKEFTNCLVESQKTSSEKPSTFPKLIEKSINDKIQEKIYNVVSTIVKETLELQMPKVFHEQFLKVVEERLIPGYQKATQEMFAQMASSLDQYFTNVNITSDDYEYDEDDDDVLLVKKQSKSRGRTLRKQNNNTMNSPQNNLTDVVNSPTNYFFNEQTVGNLNQTITSKRKVSVEAPPIPIVLFSPQVGESPNNNNNNNGEDACVAYHHAIMKKDMKQLRQVLLRHPLDTIYLPSYILISLVETVDKQILGVDPGFAVEVLQSMLSKLEFGDSIISTYAKSVFEPLLESIDRLLEGLGTASWLKSSLRLTSKFIRSFLPK